MKNKKHIDYASDPKLSPAVKEFLKPLNTGGPGLETLSIEDARNVLVSAQEAFPVDLSGIEESEKNVEFEGFSLKLKIVRAAGETKQTPAFMFIHGGGWVLGDYPTHKRMVRDLVVLTGFTGIFVDYARAPEVRYPHQPNEIYAAARWITKHGAEINVDGSNLGIVGNSAGGNLATAAALMANDNNESLFKVQILFWPVTNANFETKSYKLFGAQRFLTDPLMQWMWKQYVDADKKDEIYASPLQASPEQLKGLPPTLIQVAENDILRDEGEAYGRKLAEAGVTVTTIRYNDVIHDFGLLNGLAEIPQTKSLFLHAAAELKHYLK
jgi:acetyl esterase